MARMRLPVAVASSAVLLAGAFAGLARADVTLPAVFSDRAVLQRDRPLAVWGWAAASEEVTVSLGARTAKTTTAADGRWRVDLDAQPAGGPFELVVQGRNRVVAKDVLVGEVWLASGQSNMAWTVAGTKDAEAERKAADFPQLRVFTTAMAAAGDPAADVKGAWAATTPDTVAGFSAVAWFFARDLHRTLGVPVGVVVSSVGERVFLVGDLAHCPHELLVRDWAGLGDAHPVQAATARAEIADEAEREGAWVGSTHFSGLAVGRITASDDCRRFAYEVTHDGTGPPATL